MPKPKPYQTLRLILGDQLNIHHSWFHKTDSTVLFVMMEMRQETDYVDHHIQKLIAFFAAMRSFCDGLREKGHHVRYFGVNDPGNHQSLAKNLTQLIQDHNIRKLEYMQPDEFRLHQQLDEYCDAIDINAQVFDSEHFFIPYRDLNQYFEKGKAHLMEHFYRKMRKEHDILMNGDQPVNDKWNFDKQNRHSLPEEHEVPAPILFESDQSAIKEEIDHAEINYIGEVTADKFIWPVTRDEVLELLDQFIEIMLPHFGLYQDALSTNYWSVYHSRLSFGLNTKLISPVEVVARVQQRWLEDPKHADIAQVEGFIRQILGWREFMRGIYWANMPDYEQCNYFEHRQPLPGWYWTAATDMNCLHHAIRQSLEKAYAHHIQRLMVTGNFALLAGVDPDEVDAWYLGIYIDAIQWVEITNTRGMSQFADGGIIGSKPYVSSANYIKKMGNYCQECQYNPGKKTGDNACPFNSLYWHFIDRHRDKLSSNQRMGMIYNTWDKMKQANKSAIIEQARHYLSNIETL